MTDASDSTPPPALELVPWTPRTCPCGKALKTTAPTGLCGSCVRKRRGVPRKRQKASAELNRTTLDLAPGERMGGKGCDSGPGMCLVYRCLENLSVDYTSVGSLHVPATPGRHEAVTLPITRSHARNVGQDDAARAYRAVRIRTHWLVSEHGSNCLRDFGGGKKQVEVAEVMGTTRQRVEQIERGARRSAGLRVLADEEGEGCTGRAMAEGCSRKRPGRGSEA